MTAKVSYNAEQISKESGAHYEKKIIPFVPNVVRDGNLITGQNPFSARITAFFATPTNLNHLTLRTHI
ncbi:hypothetical protein EXE23_12475 [Acinetobacter venetianus]|nr:hypothetical protein EXE23_12475 [Acinetobacter venetianus]